MSGTLIEKLLIRAGTADSWQPDTRVIPAEEVEFVLRQHEAEQPQAVVERVGKSILDTMFWEFGTLKINPDRAAKAAITAMGEGSSAVENGSRACRGFKSHPSPASESYKQVEEALRELRDTTPIVMQRKLLDKVLAALPTLKPHGMGDNP